MRWWSIWALWCFLSDFWKIKPGVDFISKATIVDFFVRCAAAFSCHFLCCPGKKQSNLNHGYNTPTSVSPSSSSYSNTCSICCCLNDGPAVIMSVCWSNLKKIPFCYNVWIIPSGWNKDYPGITCGVTSKSFNTKMTNKFQIWQPRGEQIVLQCVSMLVDIHRLFMSIF